MIPLTCAVCAQSMARASSRKKQGEGRYSGAGELFGGYRTSVWEDGRDLGVDGGSGGAMLWWHLVPLSYALKNG